MLRIVGETNESKRIVKMCDMKPYQAGTLLSGTQQGHIVMRTASSQKFEVMDLTVAAEKVSWCDGSGLEVELLTEPITVEIDGSFFP